MVKVGVAYDEVVLEEDNIGENNEDAVLKPNNELLDEKMEGNPRSDLLNSYLFFASVAEQIIESFVFKQLMVVVTVCAGVVSGLLLYSTSPTLYLFRYLISISFAVEVILKMSAKGLSPSLYFTGVGGHWNSFDFIVSFMSIITALVEVITGSKGLRLFRSIIVLRIFKLFHEVHALHGITVSLASGLRSAVNISILVFLIMYIYALEGMFLFRENDPWHFSTIGMAMSSMLRVAAFDNWADILYINYYGCDVYPGAYYALSPIETERLGEVMYCDHPHPKPILASLFFITYCFAIPFAMFSLFIGTVSVAMLNKLSDIHVFGPEDLDSELNAKEIHQWKNVVFSPFNMNQREKRIRTNIKMAFDGKIYSEKRFLSKKKGVLYKYNKAALVCGRVVESSWFSSLLIFFLLLSAITYSISSEDHYAPYLIGLNVVVQVVFFVEVVIKIVAEAEYPLSYFYNYWNLFDFAMVIAWFLPGSLDGLRILRLIRVLGLIKDAPRLRLILSALNGGLWSISLIGFVLALFLYVCAVIGVDLFHDNNPSGFGTLHRSFLTIFQLITSDSWSDYLYDAGFGCKISLGYSGRCEGSSPRFGTAFWFFVLVMAIVQLVVLSMFIGSIEASMDEANDEHKRRLEVNRKVKIIEKQKLLDCPVSFYMDIFTKIDYTGRGMVRKAEMQLGLHIAGLKLSKNEFEFVWKRADVNCNGFIDFSEFLLFMVSLRHGCHSSRKTSSADHNTCDLRSARFLSRFELHRSDDTQVVVSDTNDDSLLDSAVDTTIVNRTVNKNILDKVQMLKDLSPQKQ